MKKTLNLLVSYANGLDKAGLFKEADIVDSILISVAEEDKKTESVLGLAASALSAASSVYRLMGIANKIRLAKGVDNMARAVNVADIVGNTSDVANLASSVTSEDATSVAVSVTGLVPNPLAKSFSLGWSVGRVLGEFGVDSAIQNMAKVFRDEDFKLELDTIAGLLNLAIAKRPAAAQLLLNKAYEVVTNLKTNQELNFNQKNALGELSNSILQANSNLAK